MDTSELTMATLGWHGWLSISLVVLSFVLFVRTRIAPDIITSGALTLLLVTGVLTPQEALAGFSNQGMITVAVLYVVVTGLTETGAVGWIGQSLLGKPRGESDARLRLMAPVAALSAFLNNTPVVGIFIPAVALRAADPAQLRQHRRRHLHIDRHQHQSGGRRTLQPTHRRARSGAV
jgi:Na+/H+ antiporter NhaD/arsenite permease-like protein